jgi:hypothetical protein
MPSDYEGIEWKVSVLGVEYPVASATVKVHDIEDADPTDGTGATALSDLSTDGSGIMAAGTLATVAVGRTVRFTVIRADGLARSITQITT